MPAKHRHQKIPPDWAVKGVTSFECAFVFGEFFINDGLLIFMIFGGETGYVDILPSGMGFYFLKYVITDTLNYATTPDPFRGRGEMAMSPPRCARLFFLHRELDQNIGARCSECPTVACSSQREARSVWNLNVSPG